MQVEPNLRVGIKELRTTWSLVTRCEAVSPAAHKILTIGIIPGEDKKARQDENVVVVHEKYEV